MVCRRMCQVLGNVKTSLASFRRSRSLVLLIVFLAIFLDNMLLTAVVPVIPNILREQERDGILNSSFMNDSIVTSASPPLQHSTACLYHLQEPQGQVRHRGSQDWTQKIWEHYAAKRSASRSCDHINMTLLDDGQMLQNWLNVTETEGGNISSPMIDENVRVGVLFASKAAVQLVVNPLTGLLISRVGCTIPMFIGFLIMMVSTIIFAYGENYTVLFFARAIQGIGSSCSTVAGMGMLSWYYPVDKERGHAMGIALGGLALGVLLGPPFGGVMYQFTGKKTPFLILASLAFLDGCLQLVAMKPSVKPDSQKGPSLQELIKDPYILLAAGSITFANMGIAMMEPALPIWMHHTMGSSEWQQGLAFLPCSVSYLLGTNLFGPLGYKLGRWRSAMLGMVIVGLCLIALPFSTKIEHLIAPNLGIGLAIGMVDSSMMPHMGYLVDLRHARVYGNVYAIADVAFCLGFATGPAVSGTIVDHAGFCWMLWMVAICNIVYAPFLFFLKDPPGKEEKECLIMNEMHPVLYISYDQTGESNGSYEDEDDCSVF